jgi:uncharacterized LabA/DUF88 family protein
MNKSQSLINAACGFCGAVALSVGLVNNNNIANTVGTALLTGSLLNTTIDHVQHQTKTSLQKQYSQRTPTVIQVQPTTRVFFDGANTDASLQILGIRANYQALVKHIAPADSIVKYYYAVSDPQSRSQTTFLQYLERINFQVVKSRKALLEDGTYKIKGDDVQIATDMAYDVNPNDHIILISGDGDFQYALTKLKDKGCQITIISTTGHFSSYLKDVADNVIDLNDLKNIIQCQPK